MNHSLDPVTLEIVKNALSSIADEMALVVLRTAYSPIVRDSMDYSTAVCDRNGRAIAQGLTLPIHLGSFPAAMQMLIEKHGETMQPGDAFIMNDPYLAGGMHLPDVYVILPVFFEDTLEGFAGAIVHHTDVGGINPGSMALGAVELYQEGLRLPLVKLYEAGVPNQAVFDIFSANSRMPTQLLGDLRAQIAACRAAERGITQLLEKYGTEDYNRYVSTLHDYAERLTRDAISRMPDGEYVAEDYLDGLGENSTPIKFKAKVTVRGDELEIDWTGTSGQVRGAINCPVATTNSVAFASVRAAIGIDVPNCDGFSRPIKVLAEKGSIVNPNAPAACAARGVIAYRMFDTLMGAFAQVVPELIPAGSEGGPTAISISGSRDGEPWLITDGILGSWGGRVQKDGVDGISSPLANMSNQPVELIEARIPVRINRYELVKDSGGAGLHRGGMALRREYELTDSTASLSVRSDRRAHLPLGLGGGLPGTPSLNVLDVNGRPELLPVMPVGLIDFRQGHPFTHIAAGGGGYGDPLARAPEAVLEDLLDEKISEAMAYHVYGVVLATSKREVDETLTNARRAALAKMSLKERGEAQLRIFAEAAGIEPEWLLPERRSKAA